MDSLHGPSSELQPICNATQLDVVFIRIQVHNLANLLNDAYNLATYLATLYSNTVLLGPLTQPSLSHYSSSVARRLRVCRTWLVSPLSTETLLQRTSCWMRSSTAR